jgi:sulfur carrier protein
MNSAGKGGSFANNVDHDAMDEGVNATNTKDPATAVATSAGVDPRDGEGIEVNGDLRTLRPATNLRALLVELGLEGKRVAVALNRSVVPRSRYRETFLSAGDRVEILEAVGGG